MKEYSVRITAAAEHDLTEIGRYIAIEKQAPLSAQRLMDRIKTAIQRLNHSPEKYRIAFPGCPWAEGIRRMNVGSFAVLFVMIDDTVSVVKVIYGAADIERRLREALEQQMRI